MTSIPHPPMDNRTKLFTGSTGSRKGISTAIGLALGAAFGVGRDEIALWALIGAVAGVTAGFLFDAMRRSKMRSAN